MRTGCSVIVVVLAGLCFPGLTGAQALFTPDPTPLERPAPLKILKSGDAAKVCGVMPQLELERAFFR